MEKTRLYSVYTPDEIIRRILKETEPLEGPTCYPVEIGYNAGNTCEPPFVKAEVYRYGEDSGQHLVFSTILDQNTTLEDFLKALAAWRAAGNFAVKIPQTRKP